jgi:hypothetical protein
MMGLGDEKTAVSVPRAINGVFHCHPTINSMGATFAMGALPFLPIADTPAI